MFRLLKHDNNFNKIDQVNTKICFDGKRTRNTKQGLFFRWIDEIYWFTVNVTNQKRAKLTNQTNKIVRYELAW